jgi:magnesium-transporting ATPase (P-type)
MKKIGGNKEKDEGSDRIRSGKELNRKRMKRFMLKYIPFVFIFVVLLVVFFDFWETCTGSIVFLIFIFSTILLIHVLFREERKSSNVYVYYVFLTMLISFVIWDTYDTLSESGCPGCGRFCALFFSVLFLVVLVAFVVLSIRHWRDMHKEPFETFSDEEYFRIGLDTIPWSNIRKMSVRKSEFGNPYVVVFLKNGEPPRSFDIGYFKDKETFLNHLKEKAAEKEYEYEEEVMI